MRDFTKGQWKLDTQDGYIRADGHPIAQVFGATVHNNEATADECFANARLILNAPDMYWTLKGLFEQIPIIDEDSRDEELRYGMCLAYRVLECLDGKEATHED